MAKKKAESDPVSGLAGLAAQKGRTDGILLAQAAKILGVSVRSARRMVKVGELPGAWRSGLSSKCSLMVSRAVAERARDLLAFEPRQVRS